MGVLVCKGENGSGPRKKGGTIQIGGGRSRAACKADVALGKDKMQTSALKREKGDSLGVTYSRGGKKGSYKSPKQAKKLPVCKLRIAQHTEL